MKGYWGAPERTAEVMIPDDEGKVWMHTGDEAEMDGEGYIKITGRIKDIIIKGGENIHPLEVENCLLAHPCVKEVSVVGLPDERYGEVVTAFVIPQANGTPIVEEDVRSWVREKLSHHLGTLYCFQPFCSRYADISCPSLVPKYVFLERIITLRPPVVRFRSSN